MFGMTLEKVLVVLVLAAVIIGPHRLPAYAHRLAALVRAVRTFTDTARTHVEREVGAPFSIEEWRALDPRQYDPRRIVRDALASGAVPGPATAEASAFLSDAVDAAAVDAAARARSAAIRAAAASPGGWRPPAPLAAPGQGSTTIPPDDAATPPTAIPPSEAVPPSVALAPPAAQAA